MLLCGYKRWAVDRCSPIYHSYHLIWGIKDFYPLMKSYCELNWGIYYLCNKENQWSSDVSCFYRKWSPTHTHTWSNAHRRTYSLTNGFHLPGSHLTVVHQLCRILPFSMVLSFFSDCVCALESTTWLNVMKSLGCKEKRQRCGRCSQYLSYTQTHMHTQMH